MFLKDDNSSSVSNHTESVGKDDHVEVIDDVVQDQHKRSNEDMEEGDTNDEIEVSETVEETSVNDVHEEELEETIPSPPKKKRVSAQRRNK